jgi:hypothetical protein
MGIEIEDFKEKLGSVVVRLFSLIIGVLAAIANLVFTIGVFREIKKDSSFSNTGFANFLAFLFTSFSTGLYLFLHFLPKKAYRLMYLLTVLLVLSLFFSGHALGLSAPIVDDCDELGIANTTYWSGVDLGNIGYAIASGTNVSTIIGRLGQPITNCVDNQIIFAGAFMLLVFHTVAIFDVQRMLLGRVKAKTYGERFVEMGIK